VLEDGFMLTIRFAQCGPAVVKGFVKKEPFIPKPVLVEPSLNVQLNSKEFH